MAEKEEKNSDNGGSPGISTSILSSCEVVGKQALLGFGVGSLLGLLPAKGDAVAEEVPKVGVELVARRMLKLGAHFSGISALFFGSLEAAKYSPVPLTSDIQHAIAGATSGLYISIAIQRISLSNVVRKVALLGVVGMLYGKANVHVQGNFGPANGDS